MLKKELFYVVLGSVDVQVDTWENRNFWRTQADEKKPEKAIVRGQHGPPCVTTRPVLKSAWKVDFMPETEPAHGHPCAGTRTVWMKRVCTEGKHGRPCAGTRPVLRSAC